MNSYSVCSSLVSLFIWYVATVWLRELFQKLKLGFELMSTSCYLWEVFYCSLRNAIPLLSVWEDLSNCLLLLIHCHPLNFVILARSIWYSFSEAVNLLLWNLVFIIISFVKCFISLDYGKCDRTRWCLRLLRLPNNVLVMIFKIWEVEEGRVLKERI